MEKEILPEEIYHGLALSALALQCIANCNHQTLFAFDPKDGAKVENLKSILQTHQINDLKDAKEVLSCYLHDRMHNLQFTKMMRELSLMTASEFKEHWDQQENPLEARRMSVAWNYKSVLQYTGIRGYDISQYVMLSRLCGTCGFLTEKEIIRRTYDITHEAKKYFQSWDEYHRNILIGDQFVHGYATASSKLQSHSAFVEAWYSLKNSPALSGIDFNKLLWS